jgi:Cu/Ag efflux pump CusA
VFPLIIERSVQAQFLVPMAASLGYGILFATVVIMLLVPALTMLEYDAAARLNSYRTAWRVARAEAH